MTTNTPETTRRTFYEIAERIAPSWERRRAQVEEVSAPVREWMLRELRPRTGHTVLELAAGTGDTGFDAAALVGDDGRLITSDFSPAMLEAARRRGSERGVRNVEYQLIDAERIELADESVDGVLCRFGYMLVADPVAALAETRRVLRPGGRLTLAVWGAPERNPFFGTIGISLIQRGHLDPPAPPPAPGIFSLADAGRTETLLHGAGFDDVRAEEVPLRFEVPDIGEYLSMIADTAGPVGLVLQALPESERAAVTTDVADSLRQFATDSGYQVPGVALCAAAA